MRFGSEWNCESTLNITTCNRNWRTILSKTWYFIVKPCRIFPPIRILKTVNKMTTPPMFHETVAQNLDFYYWDITHINIFIFHFWSYKIRNWLNLNNHFIEKHFLGGGGGGLTKAVSSNNLQVLLFVFYELWTKNNTIKWFKWQIFESEKLGLIPSCLVLFWIA